MFPSQENMIIPLLEILSRFPGGIRTHRVYSLMAEYYPQSAYKDRKTKRSGSDTYWNNNIRFARIKAIKRGYMVEGSPWGVWQLSPQGQLYLQVNRAAWAPQYSKKGKRRAYSRKVVTFRRRRPARTIQREVAAEAHEVG